jgi:TPR repeat protein
MSLGSFRRNALLTLSVSALTLLVVSVAHAGAEPDAFVPSLHSGENPRNIDSQIALGNAYFIGKGVPRDTKMAAYWFERAANLGDPGAQNGIGFFYQTGTGVPKDPERAFHWYQLSAANGSSEGKVNLAIAYFWGIGVTAQPELAQKLLEEAAAAGNGIAATYLGDFARNGIGSRSGESEARRWYEKGASLHNYLAEYRMGVILSDPKWGRTNIKRAAKLLRESANDGFVPSMYSLAFLIVKYPELGDRRVEAIKLLNDAADVGVRKASIVLGILSRDGKWGPKNAGDAYLHFKIATLQGGKQIDAGVQHELSLLTTQLDAAELARVDAEATNWFKAHDGPALEFLFKSDRKTNWISSVALARPADGGHAGTLVPYVQN